MNARVLTPDLTIDFTMKISGQTAVAYLGSPTQCLENRACWGLCEGGLQQESAYAGGAASRRHGVLRTEAEALWRVELAS